MVPVTEGLQVAVLVGAACLQRDDVVHVGRRLRPAFSQTDRAEGILRKEGPANKPPFVIIATGCGRSAPAVDQLVPLCVILGLMLSAETAVCLLAAIAPVHQPPAD